MKCKHAILIIYIILFFQIQNTIAQVAISVAPTVVEETWTPGTEKTITIYLFNELDRDVDVIANVTGLKMNNDGLPYPVSADDKWSCADWITVTPMTFQLKGHEREMIEAVIKIPRDAKGGKYAIVLFDVNTNDDKPENGIKIKGQLGTVFLIKMDRTLEPNGLILKNDIYMEQGNTIFASTFENTGNCHVHLTGSVALRDSTQRIVDRIPLDMGTGTVLPESKRTFKGIWTNKKKLNPGAYLAEFRVTYQGNKKNLDEKVIFIISKK